MTKAELQEQLDTALQANDDFRRLVARNALAAGRRYGFCPVLIAQLQKLGLQDVMPHRFVLQFREKDSRRKWIDYDRAAGITSKGSATRFYNDLGLLTKDMYDHRIVEVDGYGTVVNTWPVKP